jgi:hypothetical protein
MLRLRYWSVPILLLLPASLVLSQEKKAPSPWFVDRELTLTPKSPPTPALKYRLMPLKSDLKEGNAAPIYLRLVHEQNDDSRKYRSETPRPWNLLPIDKIPLDEAHKFLKKQDYALRQFELGARRKSVDWAYTLDVDSIISLLLPDAQVMRSYVPMLVLQIRVAIAEGDYVKAAHNMETGFAFSQHVGGGPFLINSLVGIALGLQFTTTIADLIERPDAPNFYWAIATLPRPLIDLRTALDQEYKVLETEFRELADLEREYTAAKWDAILRRLRTDLRKFANNDEKLPDWFPKNFAPDDPASKSPELDEARRFVVKAKGISAEKVAAMPPAQVMLMYIVGTYQQDRDAWFSASYLPFPQGRRWFALREKELKDAPATEAHIIGRVILPAMGKVMVAQMRLERYLAILQAIEALRIHAVGHNGKLPGKLGDVTEVSVPNDPGTGQPFEYKLEGETATIVSTIPDEPGSNGFRFRITMRKSEPKK